MQRDKAVELLSGFINLHTHDDESGDRELYHEALSYLENIAIRVEMKGEMPEQPAKQFSKELKELEEIEFNPVDEEVEAKADLIRKD